MLRSFLLMMLMVGGLSAYGQQAVVAKKACDISQCQARKTSTASSASTAATAMTVAQTTATATDRATAPAISSSCGTKALVIPTSLQVKALASGNEGAKNCDPRNCNPANCVPGSSSTATKMATTLAVKQE